MSKRPHNYQDPWSTLIVVLTLGLFIVALVVKGFTHDLLLEAGVFLVSAKLIFMAYKLGAAGRVLEERLDIIQETLRRIEDSERSG
jgi:glucose-6-phosphate-specific signal transduction histidine kinase